MYKKNTKEITTVVVILYWEFNWGFAVGPPFICSMINFLLN